MESPPKPLGIAPNPTAPKALLEFSKVPKATFSERSEREGKAAGALKKNGAAWGVTCVGERNGGRLYRLD